MPGPSRGQWGGPGGSPNSALRARVLGVAAACSALGRHGALARVVRAPSGPIEGYTIAPRGDDLHTGHAGILAETVEAFLGIPFAQPPVGALRWRGPQPVLAWTDTRDATVFGADCANEYFSQSETDPLGKTAHLPCVSTAYVDKTLPSPCVFRCLPD